MVNILRASVLFVMVVKLKVPGLISAFSALSALSAVNPQGRMASGALWFTSHALFLNTLCNLCG